MSAFVSFKKKPIPKVVAVAIANDVAPNNVGVTMKLHCMNRPVSRAVATAVVALACGASAQAGLVNGGFESYGVAANNYEVKLDYQYAGWRTTATDHYIEVWGDNFQGVKAYKGNNFVELNAFQVSTLYQDVDAIAAGSGLGFHFAHRGRLGVDTMRLTITDMGVDNIFGNADDRIIFTQEYADGSGSWGYYTNTTPLFALGNRVRFAYASVSAAQNNPTAGNFLDDADFFVTAPPAPTAVPEPASLALSVLGLFAACGVRASVLGKGPRAVIR